MTTEFTYLEGRPIHFSRGREILKTHPEIRDLMDKNPWTALWTVMLVTTQWVTAIFANDLVWYWIIPLAYLLGAFLNHALYVVIHECTHNLVLKHPRANNLVGIFCDFALVVPSAMAFRKYHLMHHKFLGQYLRDPDIVRHEEARLIGNSPVGKAVWLFMFSVSQALRPLQIKEVQFWDRWIITNFVAVVLVDILVFVLIGPQALVYLALSTLFALGLHPLGGRWIQEHYLTAAGQETYSYYGPLNKTCFNMGYHNEHHDFATIPWNNLPKVKQLAPEYYDHLKSYQSWTTVLLHYIFDPEMSSYSRIVRPAINSDECSPLSD
ncbi:MAG: fatty acid desaturase [Legionellales bacterium]|nr:fatty acid desaturase [Legionellales bacterium]HCU90399.1 fatty acid desaturase [Gammaproteobacteria bacterium]|tara:strand:- start:204 stop:1172 length:969 start_codon:yes stop_codon:yes gene_type:complete